MNINADDASVVIRNKSSRGPVIVPLLQIRFGFPTQGVAKRLLCSRND
jgi:hypothetical protein